MPRRRNSHRKKALGVHPSQLAFSASGVIVENKCTFSIWLGRPEGGQITVREEPFEAILDSGATATCLHPSVVKELGLPIVDRCQVRVADGRLRDADVAAVALMLKDPSGTFEKPLFRVIRAMIPVNSQGDLLLGMDFLGSGVFEIDGPNGRWSWKLFEKHVRQPGQQSA